MMPAMQFPAAPTQLGQMNHGQFQDIWNQGMVHNILQANPGMRRVYSEDNMQVHMPTPQRLGDPITHGRFSEFYPQGEIGGGDQLPNPWNLNHYNLELYHPDALHNPEIRQSLTMGEMLHGLPNDPLWNSLKNQFMGQFSPAVLGHFKDVPRDEFNRNQADAFLRASFFKNPSSGNGLHPPAYAPPGDYWNNNEWTSHYSPDQQKTIDQMKDYMQSGTVHYIPEDYQ